jgi:predicted nucleotidyltransferase
MSLISPVPDLKVDLPLEQIQDLCRRYDVQELDVFGSALRDDFGPESDIDFLVVFKDNDYGPWASKLTELEEDLSRLLNRNVDLVSKPAIQTSENYIRRKYILESARALYVA